MFVSRCSISLGTSLLFRCGPFWRLAKLGRLNVGGRLKAKKLSGWWWSKHRMWLKIQKEREREKYKVVLLPPPPPPRAARGWENVRPLGAAPSPVLVLFFFFPTRLSPSVGSAISTLVDVPFSPSFFPSPFYNEQSKLANQQQPFLPRRRHRLCWPELSEESVANGIECRPSARTLMGCCCFVFA